ncbi:MAG: sulfatase-like hydrolase/transferase [Polyangiaceae bacterium]|nr:sulfatase-like hydrolase/transferase [Polyangiaceae bacterium]
MPARRLAWGAVALGAVVIALDVVRRAGRVAELRSLELVSYAASALLSGSLWAALLVAGLGPGRGRHAARLLFVALAAALFGGQAYFHHNYAAYIDDAAARFGAAFSTSVLAQLRADGRHLAWTHARPALAAAALVGVVAARARVEAGVARRAWGVAAGALLVAVAVPWISSPRQAATPDVLLVHAVGSLARAKLGLAGGRQALPGEHSPEYIPAFVPRPSRPRNVLFVLTESVPRDLVCLAGEQACDKTPFSHRAAPRRIGFTGMRANDSTTAISVGVLFTGLSPTASRDAIHRAPMIWEIARAAGYDTGYFTSQDLRFGNSDMFIRNVPVSRRVSGAELDPNADLDLGAHDGLATAYALRELATMREPFLAVVHLSNTHFPYRIDEGDEPFQPAEFTKDPAKNDAFRRHFQNAVRAQDRTVGALIDGVRRAAYGDRTVILFTSDHGEAFREHGQLGHTLSVYDEEILVPAWIDAPAPLLTDDERASLEDARARQVFHTDVVPTLIDLLGATDAPEVARFVERLPGRSLLRPYTPYAAPLTNCSELWTCPFKSWGVMRGPRKLEARQWDQGFHCFDVVADPREQRDLGAAACGDLEAEARRVFGGHPGDAAR